MSLLEKAGKRARRLKMYVFGESGTGKTITALHFPGVAMIDTEKGSEYYGEFFEFDRIQTSDPDKVHKVLDDLLESPGSYKTFVIDPFTALYDTIMDKRLKTQRMRTGRMDYVLQPLDYKFIKGELKSIVNKLLTLDMNVICTAPSKILYSGEKEDFMKVIGTDPDGPKQLPFMFDVVLELKTEGDKRLAFARKDRTNRLPKDEWFEFSYANFCKYLGAKELERDAVVFRQQELLENKDRNVVINYGGKEIKTAGISAESIKVLEALSKKVPDELKAKLREDYFVDSVLDLREDEAKLLIEELSGNN